MWDSGGCDASYPLTPVSPFASLREEVPLGSLAVSSRGSGVSPLPLRRSLWPESEDFADTIDASEQLIVTLTGPRRRRHFL